MLGLFIDTQAFHSGEHGLPYKDLRTGNGLWGHTSLERNYSIFAAWLYKDEGSMLLMCCTTAWMQDVARGKNMGTIYLFSLPCSDWCLSLLPSLWRAEIGVSYCAIWLLSGMCVCFQTWTPEKGRKIRSRHFLEFALKHSETVRVRCIHTTVHSVDNSAAESSVFVNGHQHSLGICQWFSCGILTCTCISQFTRWLAGQFLESKG